ncbi:MAG TPA: hypothetical protein VK210_11590, partial [Terriglobia bacterium]|nr:hypothetical protein [Terriglobia bacterium]
FHFDGVLPGRYRMTGNLTGFPNVVREVVVTDQPMAGIERPFPAFALTGRVLLDDGSAFPDIQRLSGVAVSSSANDISLDIDDMGRFKAVLKYGEYRFYVENLPDDYVIRSITAGTADLLKETIKVDAITAVNVDVRMARKTDASSPNGGSTAGRVLGKLIDFDGGKSSAESVQICCTSSGPVKQFSSRVRPDGSFEVSGIPAGSYTAEVMGPVPVFVVNPNVDVGPQGATLRLMTAEQLIPLLVRIQTENPDLLTGLHMSVTLTSASGVEPIVWEFEEDGIAQPSVPGGRSYAVGLLNVPDGFVVKSISSDDDGDLLHGKRLNVADSPPAFIDVTLGPK